MDRQIDSIVRNLLTIARPLINCNGIVISYMIALTLYWRGNVYDYISQWWIIMSIVNKYYEETKDDIMMQPTYQS